MAHARGRQLLACLRRVLLLHRESLLVLAVLSRTTRAGSIGRGAVLPRRPLKLWARILEVWPPIVALPSRRGAVSRQQCSLEQPGDAAMLRMQDAGFAVQQAVTPASLSLHQVLQQGRAQPAAWGACTPSCTPLSKAKQGGLASSMQRVWCSRTHPAPALQPGPNMVSASSTCSS